MPKMQVTFSNPSQSPRPLKINNQLTSLGFRIEYCGKSYNCTGHIKPNSGLDREEKPVRFSGYCGYNGRMDIQKLSAAAEDYYWSIIERMRPGSSLLIDKQSDNTPSEAEVLADSAMKSYEFNIGHVL
jgi:hypothetical protein